MIRETETIYCKNCGVEINGLPVIENGCFYCCQDCFHQLPCECAAVFEIEDDRPGEGSSVIALLAAYAG